MRFLLRPLRLTLPFLTTFSGVWNPSVAYAKSEAHFAREASLEDAFLEALDGAKRRIDLAVPDLAEANLNAKLATLAATGIKVNVRLGASNDPDYHAVLDGKTVLILNARHLADRGDASLIKTTKKELQPANTEDVAEAIDQADRTIDLVARDLRQTEVYDALNRAAARGVQIRILLEGREFSGEPAPGTCKDAQAGDGQLDECLGLKSNVDLRYLYSPFVDGRQARIQTSFAVIDGKVATAMNPSHLVTFKGRKQTKGFNSQFDRSFAAGREPFRRLAENGVCGRLKTVSMEMGSMRQLQRFVASCD